MPRMYIENAHIKDGKAQWAEISGQASVIPPVATNMLRRMKPETTYASSQIGWLNWGTYKACNAIVGHRFSYTPQGLARMSGKHVKLLEKNRLIWMRHEESRIVWELTFKGIELQTLIGQQTLKKGTDNTWLDKG